MTADHLGSTRAVTDATGTLAACSDYLPFGEDEPISTGDPRLALPCYAAEKPRQKFTGQPRDLETNLDFFGARYLSAPQGRFLSADNPFLDQDPSDPQSWNLYGHVRNNPLKLVDPSGNCAEESVTTVDKDGNPVKSTNYRDDGGTPCLVAVLTGDFTNNPAPTAADGAIRELSVQIALNFRLSSVTSVYQGGLSGAGNILFPGEAAAGKCAYSLFGGPACDTRGLAMAVLPFGRMKPTGLSRWGWPGTSKFLKAVGQLKNAGTHTEVRGLVPTLQEAKELIRRAGGTIDRIEEGHAIGGISPHTYPHINYTTSSGLKATVRIVSAK